MVREVMYEADGVTLSKGVCGMATNYQRGYAFENRIVRFFRDLGFFVIRAAGSKGPVDVIAWDEHSLYLIQAKANSISPSELLIAKDALSKIPLPAGDIRVYCEVWVKGNPKLGDWFTRHTVYSVYSLTVAGRAYSLAGDATNDFLEERARR